VLEFVAEFRRADAATPVVLMGYANPIERMGLATFAARAKAAGVDGVLVVDSPPEESVDLLAAMDAVGIDVIYLLAPTSTDARVDLVCKAAKGYIYYVSLKGVTGASHIDTSEVEAAIARIRARTHLPVGVGFGIRDGDTARRIAAFADAAVIGSRIIQEMEAHRGEELERVRALVTEISRAMNP
jgi:tryptophan synthase alpha chain